MKIGTQFTTKTSVDYAEPCRVVKGVPELAKYGLLQEAATVEISPEGSKRAVDYVNNAALEKQEKIYDTGAVIETEKFFDELIDAALNGGELSQDEQERLDTELFGRIQIHYNEMQNLRLSDNDERILEELKNHFLMKQQALKDMRQAAADKLQTARNRQKKNERLPETGKVRGDDQENAEQSEVH